MIQVFIIIYFILGIVYALDAFINANCRVRDVPINILFGPIYVPVALFMRIVLKKKFPYER